MSHLLFLDKEAVEEMRADKSKIQKHISWMGCMEGLAQLKSNYWGQLITGQLSKAL